MSRKRVIDPTRVMVWIPHATACVCRPLQRGFLRRLFVEETPANAAFKGLAWLVLGVPVTDGLLYDDDWQVGVGWGSGGVGAV